MIFRGNKVMQKKVIIITSLIFSILFISTVFFFSETACASHHRSARHHRSASHHHKRYFQLPVIKSAENDHRWDVNPHVWTLALKAYNNAFRRGYVKQKLLTIIDYSLPSSAKRMWVVDVSSKKVLYHTLV